jgi:hypothetical protein
LTDVYIFIHTAPSVTGNDLSIHLTDYGSTYLRPGSCKTHTTFAGGIVSGVWKKITFSSNNDVVRGQPYWIIVGDSTQAASPYSLLGRGGGGYCSTFVTGAANVIVPFYHVTGFNGDGSSFSSPWSGCVLKFSDGSVFGSPGTENATFDAQTTTIKGAYIPAIEEDITVCGIAMYSGSMDIDIVYLNVYEDGATVSAGPLYPGFNGGAQFTIGTPAHYGGGAIWIPDTRLRKGHSYRFMFSGSGGIFGCYYYSIADAATGGNDFLLCGTGNGALYYTKDNGGTAWTTYNTDSDLRYFGGALVVKEWSCFPRALVGIR